MMREIINIGKESFLLKETKNGYELRALTDNAIYEIRNHGELNETIYRMIDRICPAMV